MNLLSKVISAFSAKPIELKMLNLGCGRHFHRSWVNVDLVSSSPEVISHDLRQPLPFENESFDVVYHSHVIEHLPRPLAPRFLLECYRVLRPRGVLRVAAPDLETIARLYLKNLEGAIAGEANASARYDWMILELLDQLVRDRSGGDMGRYWWLNPMPAEEFVIARVGQEALSIINTLRQSGVTCSSVPEDPPTTAEQEMQFRQTGELHRWMYDRYSLGALLKKAGFLNAKVCAANESAIPNFNTFQLDIGADGTVRKPDSLFMEATRPDLP